MRGILLAVAALVAATAMGTMKTEGAPARPRSYDLARPATATTFLGDAYSPHAVFEGGRLDVSYHAVPGLGRDATRAAFLGHAHRLFGNVFTASQVKVACLHATSVSQDIGVYDDGNPAMSICMPRYHFNAIAWPTMPPDHLSLYASHLRLRRDVARL